MCQCTFICEAEVSCSFYTALAFACLFYFIFKFLDSCAFGSNLPVQSLLYCARYAISSRFFSSFGLLTRLHSDIEQYFVVKLHFARKNALTL